MPFEKGHKFGKGNKGAKLIEEALRRAILQDDSKRLRQGCEKLLDLLAEGDLGAFHAVADRIDGKPGQSIEMNVNRETREYTTEELLERIAEIRGRIAAGDAEAKEGPAKPSGLH